MQGFEDVSFGWGGEEYTVPADQQLMLIAKIEDALSAGTGKQAIGVLLQSEGPSYSRLACAYGAALRHAGAEVTDEEVYLKMMDGLAQGKSDVISNTQDAVLALIAVVSPPMGHALIAGASKKNRKTKADEG